MLWVWHLLGLVRGIKSIEYLLGNQVYLFGLVALLLRSGRILSSLFDLAHYRDVVLARSQDVNDLFVVEVVKKRFCLLEGTLERFGRGVGGHLLYVDLGLNHARTKLLLVNLFASLVALVLEEEFINIRF